MEFKNVSREIDDLKANVDSIFLVLNGIIITLMQAGFCCLELGAVRSKNSINIVMKNLLDMFICVILYYLIGFPLAYGEGNPFLGLTWWAGVGLSDSSLAFWFFQFTFTATAATILSGAVAERCEFVAYLAYNAFISGFIYPVVTHWVWHEEGWLFKLGFQDFAGSGAVHLLAGSCSFVGAAILGPRIGRFQDGRPVDMPGHSMPMVGLGALLLITGFLAFNGGSIGHASKPGDGISFAKAAINTIMGGSGAGTVSVILGRLGVYGEAPWTYSMNLNALLAGMVSVCAGVNVYSSIGAYVTGVFACPIFLAIHHLVLKCQVDDPLDAVAVHFGGGFWGVLAVPFIAPSGIVYTGTQHSFLQLGYNIIGLGAIFAWSLITSLILFGSLNYFGLLRVPEEIELKGLDETKHGESSYPSSAWYGTKESHSGILPVKVIPTATSEGKKEDYENIGFEMERL